MNRVGKVIGAGIVMVAVAWPAAAQDLKAALSGKTIVSGQNVIEIKSNGSLAGKVGKDTVAGTWSIGKDGKWCRTFTKPQRLAGSACQKATLKGRDLTVFRDDGTKTEWVIQ